MMLNAFAALRRLRLRSLADELEIERLTAERDQSDAKFKQAVADLEKQAGELNEAKLHIDHLGITFNQRLADAVQDYEADALAMRKKRAADRKRMAGKRNG